MIKTNLFHKYKYVRSKDDLKFLTHPNSLAQMVLKELNVPDEQTIQSICWNQIRYLVPKQLNYTRTIKLNAIKLKCDGKSNKVNRVVIYNTILTITSQLT